MNNYRPYSSLAAPKYDKNTAEVDLGALTYNYSALVEKIKSANPNTRPICVVKADAYGHGAPAVASALRDAGCDFFAVATVEEALALRGFIGEGADILILGYTDPRYAEILASADLIQTLISPDHAAALCDCAAEAGVKIRVHVALDTGMNRVGFAAYGENEISHTVDALSELSRASELSLEGLFTHFACADGEFSPVLPTFDEKVVPSSLSAEEFTVLQFSRYTSVADALARRGLSSLFRHVSNSAALRHSEYILDGVRLGIMLYGAYPSEFISEPPLRPVMTLRTLISHIHELSPHESVGYGRCFTSNIPRRIATLPIGYADGVLRRTSGAAVRVISGGTEYSATVVGRVCMDQMTVDVTDVPCSLGDAVIIFGGKSTKSLADLARHSGTIEYEILCAVSSRVPRAYK